MIAIIIYFFSRRSVLNVIYLVRFSREYFFIFTLEQLAIVSRPDLEGPNRPITEEEFFDAVEEALDKRDQMELELNESNTLRKRSKFRKFF